MYEAVSISNCSVVFASVSGFVEKKNKYWISSDYVFVVEIFWSDKRTTFIKRNYDDFIKFHKDLTEYFQTKYDRGTIKTPVYIPCLEGKSIFLKNTVQLAEKREMEVHGFLKQLLGGNPLISNNKIVLDFFRLRPADPVPNREPPDGACSDNVFSIDDAFDDEDDVLFDR